MEDIVEWAEGDYAIVKSVRPFGTGWNCYRRSGGDEFRKMNPRYECFLSFDAAKEWLDESNYVPSDGPQRLH
jgi:hypothetical protein